MYKNCFWIVGVIAILIYNGFMLAKKNETIRILNIAKMDKQEEIEAYKFNDSVRFFENSKFVKKDLKFKTVDGEEISIQEIVDLPKFVIRYSKLSCIECVKNELLLLKNFIRDVGVENIIIITDYNDIAQLYRFKRINGIENITTYLSVNGSFDFINELYEIPYYFLLKKDLSIHSIFIPDKRFNNMTKRYFRLVKRGLSSTKTILCKP